jgi:hypothetical protein
MNTTDNNKLIAEFMGAKPNRGEFDLFGTSSMGDVFKDVDGNDEDAKHFFLPEEMKFHENWNWLMPCISKLSPILLENIEDANTERLIHGIEDDLLKGDINAVYNQVIEAIETLKTTTT